MSRVRPRMRPNIIIMGVIMGANLQNKRMTFIFLEKTFSWPLKPKPLL